MSAIVLAGSATADTGVTSLILPIAGAGGNLVASIVSSGPTATVYSVVCAPKSTSPSQHVARTFSDHGESHGGEEDDNEEVDDDDAGQSEDQGDGEVSAAGGADDDQAFCNMDAPSATVTQGPSTVAVTATMDANT
jgi:hypothetical protein